jgi:hypothetical protein
VGCPDVADGEGTLVVAVASEGAEGEPTPVGPAGKRVQVGTTRPGPSRAAQPGKVKARTAAPPTLRKLLLPIKRGI